MLRISPAAIVLAGISAVIATVAPAAINLSPGGAEPRTFVRVAGEAAVKGDRLHAPRPPVARAAVSSVELVGVSDTVIVLKDRSGTVLYRSDPQTNTTLVTKNADLPAVTVKERAESTVRTIEQREISPASSSGPSSQPERRKRMPVGCEAVVSALVASNQARTPSLCLADAGMHQQS